MSSEYPKFYMYFKIQYVQNIDKCTTQKRKKYKKCATKKKKQEKGKSEQKKRKEIKVRNRN